MRNKSDAAAKDPLSKFKFGREIIILCASAILVIIGAVYFVHGARSLFSIPGDYRMRWIEERYVFEGKNPIDIFERVQAEKKNEPVLNTGRDNRIDPALGYTEADYPPWAYFTGALFTWPTTFAAARVYFGILNILLFAGILAWCYQIGKTESTLLGLFLPASVFAVNSICSTFIIGQYGVIVLASLIAAYLYEKTSDGIVGGLCLGIAMTKFTLSGPFLLIFFIRRRWRSLGSCIIYLILASLVIWPIVKTNPIEMLGQMVHEGETFTSGGAGLNNLLVFFGLSVHPATILAAFFAVIIAGWLLYLWRSSSLLTSYAIAGVAARAWSYHGFPDNLILIFLLIELTIILWRTPNFWGLCSYILLGISLWVPVHFAVEHGEGPIQWILQWIAWVLALAVLLYMKKAEMDHEPFRSLQKLVAKKFESGELLQNQNDD